MSEWGDDGFIPLLKRFGHSAGDRCEYVSCCITDALKKAVDEIDRLRAENRQLVARCETAERVS